MATSPTPLHLLTFSQFQSSSLEQQKILFNQFQAVVVKSVRCGCCEMKEMPELPVEIQEMIWNHLDPATLAICCRLSQHHAGSFRKRLWQKIQLSDSQETLFLIKCLARLDDLSRNRFTDSVKELVLNFDVDDEKESRLAFEFLQSKEWKLFKKVEKLKIDGARRPSKQLLDIAEEDSVDICWSLPLSKLRKLKELTLANIEFSFAKFGSNEIWEKLTLLRLANVEFRAGDVSDFFILDSKSVPKLQDLFLDQSSGELLNVYLPLASQIQTLSIPTSCLLQPIQQRKDVRDSVLPLFTNLTALHLSDWNLDVVTSISALPNLQLLLLESTHSAGMIDEKVVQEMIAFFTDCQEEWIENTSITFSRSSDIKTDLTELETMLKFEGILVDIDVNFEDWWKGFQKRE